MTMTASRRARAIARGRYDFSSSSMPASTSTTSTISGRSFSFGDPEPIMSRRELIDYLECWNNGRYYEPPIPMAALTRAENVSPHHASAIGYKVKQLAKDFIPHRLLDRATFAAWAHNYAVTGNGYLEVVPNRIGGIARLKNSLAKYTRRGLVDGEFFYVPNGRDIHAFEPGSVFHLARLGLDQEIYGVPDYLSCLQSAFLNEAAVLFRRKYYLNGSHAGFIMYVNEEKLSEADADEIENALERSKGPGNFRNFFLHIPGGKEKGVQLIHPGEAAAKDEFMGVKGTTRDDILAAHRMYPVLIGVVPQNAGGLGDPEKADAVYYRNETVPTQQEFMGLNDWLGEEVVRFAPREVKAAA
jgi:PBSX family phage portal protein